MSEEILKALTQLFAIITKQDSGVTERERQFVINFFKTELDQDSVKEYLALYDQYSGYGREDEGKGKLTSVRDSVKTLGICRKINKTLTQKQKIVVLIKLLELVSQDKNFTSQRMEIINTVSEVFNIEKDEYQLIEAFVREESNENLDFDDILIVDSSETASAQGKLKHLHGHIGGMLIFMRVSGVDMYFTKYLGEESTSLNGFPMQPNRVYLFSHGSTIKTQSGDALYYSDIVANFNEELKTTRLSFNATIDELVFPNGTIGLRNVVISEGPGKLIGIMGASGAGKTTLLNVLAGLVEPTKGQILINGFDLHKEKDKIHGVIGYVSQDDLLIEELTVYDNLYYNARLCFAGMSEEELHKRTMDMLESLGLDQRKDLRVGNVLEKTISGGQRKRLNIALELIREPSVLFVDEPTSGLSSRDSENIMDLLKELALKGKLVFVVIHQPSSDIFKMFDRLMILDQGGYPIFYGNSVDSVVHFKTEIDHANCEERECPTCGNVNPEQIFNIIEAKVVDEFGNLTPKRKISPQEWNKRYINARPADETDRVIGKPHIHNKIPNRWKQFKVYFKRDVLSKLTNTQYILLNTVEAPALALILAFFVKYFGTSSLDSNYTFESSENLPQFLFID